MDRIVIVQALLNSEDNFVRKCITLLYDHQEEDEQATEESLHQNGVGFNKSDARILTEAAEHIDTIAITPDIRKRMPKYARQLLRYLTDEDIGL